MKKLNKIIWCIHIALFVSGLITKHYNLQIVKVFMFCLQISTAIIFSYTIYYVLVLLKHHKERKMAKLWLAEHMSIMPESREVVLTVNSQLEKWQEDIISKVEKAASEKDLKSNSK